MTQIHDMEEKRKNNLKFVGKDEKKKSFKSAGQLEKEKQDAKWNSGKVQTLSDYPIANQNSYRCEKSFA